MGREFNGLVHNNQYYIYGFKIPKELYSKIKHKCEMWNEETQKLQQENQQLKSVLDEIRELLNETFEYGDEWHWDSGTIRDYLEDIEKLLDKVKE